MSSKNSVARVLLILYALGSLAVAVALLLDLPDTGELAGTTSGMILAGAILALAFGAARAARDPWRNRLMIQVLIGFTALATVAIVIRLLFHNKQYDVDPAWIVLPFAAVASVLLVVFYPRTPPE